MTGMMLYFQDVDGEMGEISDSLGVCYRGQWDAEVTDFVAAVEDDRDGTGFGGLDVVTHLLIELPTEIPIAEINRQVI